MKKIVNGKAVTLTAEEIAEMEKYQMDMPAPELTPEERLTALEEKLKKLSALWGGFTGGN